MLGTPQFIVDLPLHINNYKKASKSIKRKNSDCSPMFNQGKFLDDNGLKNTQNFPVMGNRLGPRGSINSGRSKTRKVQKTASSAGCVGWVASAITDSEDIKKYQSTYKRSSEVKLTVSFPSVEVISSISPNVETLLNDSESSVSVVSPQYSKNRKLAKNSRSTLFPLPTKIAKVDRGQNFDGKGESLPIFAMKGESLPIDPIPESNFPKNQTTMNAEPKSWERKTLAPKELPKSTPNLNFQRKPQQTGTVKPTFPQKDAQISVKDILDDKFFQKILQRSQFNADDDSKFFREVSEFFDQRIFNDLRLFIENERNESFFAEFSIAGLESELKNSQLQIDKLNYWMINYKFYNKIIGEVLKARGQPVRRPAGLRGCKRTQTVGVIPKDCHLNHLQSGRHKSLYPNGPYPRILENVPKIKSMVSKNTIGGGKGSPDRLKHWNWINKMQCQIDVGQKEIPEVNNKSFRIFKRKGTQSPLKPRLVDRKKSRPSLQVQPKPRFIDIKKSRSMVKKKTPKFGDNLPLKPCEPQLNRTPPRPDLAARDSSNLRIRKQDDHPRKISPKALVKKPTSGASGVCPRPATDRQATSGIYQNHNYKEIHAKSKAPLAPHSKVFFFSKKSRIGCAKKTAVANAKKI